MVRLRATGSLIASVAAFVLLIGCDDEETDSGPAGPDASADAAAAEAGIAEEAGADAAELDGETGAPQEAGTMRRACAPFGPSVLSPATAFGDSVILADFDCDSRLDAVRNHYLATPGGLVGGAVVFYAGKGDGSFSDGIPIEIPGGPTDLAAGDFDGDGVTDLAVAVVSGIQSEHSALLLIRGQCGKLPSEAEVIFEPNPFRGTDSIVADMNGDGADDLIVSRARERNRIEVLFGGAAPLQTSAASEQVPEGVLLIGLADLDGDGMREVIAAGESRWAILSKSDDGSLLIVGVSEVDAEGLIGLEAMDVDSDGVDELIALRSGAADSVDAYRHGPGTERFVRRTLIEGPGIHRIVVGDITGDGRQDLAAVAQHHTELLLNSRSGLMRAGLPSTEGTLAIGDVTGDGYGDLVYGSREWLKVYPNQPLSCEHRLPRW